MKTFTIYACNIITLEHKTFIIEASTKSEAEKVFDRLYKQFWNRF